MPASADELMELLDLEAIEDDLYRGKQPDTSMQRVFGGQVAAQAYVAATRTVDKQYVVHSLHSYFLRPGDTRVPIVYDVEDVRNGRSFATRRVLARQHGRPIYAMTANYQIPEDGFEHQDAMPDVPPPDACPTLGEVMKMIGREEKPEWEKEWAALEVRYAGNSRRGGELDIPGEPAHARLWIRVNGTVSDDEVSQAAAFTYASDMTLLGATTIPHGKYLGAPGMQPASLDHTIWFHRPFRADEWWLYDQHSPFAGGSRGLALARVFTTDGTLVATVAQEGLIRYRPS